MIRSVIGTAEIIASEIAKLPVASVIGEDTVMRTSRNNAITITRREARVASRKIEL